MKAIIIISLSLSLSLSLSPLSLSLSLSLSFKCRVHFCIHLVWIPDASLQSSIVVVPLPPPPPPTPATTKVNYLCLFMFCVRLLYGNRCNRFILIVMDICKEIKLLQWLLRLTVLFVCGCCDYCWSWCLRFLAYCWLSSKQIPKQGFFFFFIIKQPTSFCWWFCCYWGGCKDLGHCCST